MPKINVDIPCPTCNKPVPVEAADRINKEGIFADTVACRCPNCAAEFDTHVELRVSLVRWRVRWPTKKKS